MMKRLRKLAGIATSALVFCALAYGWLGPGTVRQVAAQDAAPANLTYLPLIAGAPGASDATEAQNYTVAEAPSTAELAAAAVDGRGKPVLRPSLYPRYAVSVTNDVVYGNALVTMNGLITPTQLLLDLYEPADAPAKLRPTILIVHGGAFIRGTRREANLVRAANEYAARGYVVAAMGYRLGGGPTFATTGKLGPFPVVTGRVHAYQTLVNGVDSIRFLDFLGDPATIAFLNPIVRLGQAAALDDTLSALDWLTTQADQRRLDLSRLVMFGGSAGSIDSLHTAYALDDLGIVAPRIAAVVDHWGAFNLDDADVSTDGTAFMEKREAALFIVHGTADVEVPIAFGDAIFQRAKQVRIPVKMIRVQDGRHGFAAIDIFSVLVNKRETIFQRSVRFLDETLFDQNRLVIAAE